MKRVGRGGNNFSSSRQVSDLKRSIVAFSVTLADPLSIRLVHSLPGKHFFIAYIRLALQSASFVDPVFASPALLYLNCLLLTLQYLYYCLPLYL